MNQQNIYTHTLTKSERPGSHEPRHRGNQQTGSSPQLSLSKERQKGFWVETAEKVSQKSVVFLVFSVCVCVSHTASAARVSLMQISVASSAHLHSSLHLVESSLLHLYSAVTDVGGHSLRECLGFTADLQ